MSDQEERMNEYKLLAIRGHLRNSRRLNLTEARWLVEELIASKRRHARALEAELRVARADAWDEGWDACDEDYKGSTNPYRRGV